MPVDAALLSMRLQPVPCKPSQTREAKRERALARKAKFGQEVKKRASAEPKKPRALRGRAGGLEGLMGVPKDIFYEIVSWLEPLDLLYLARASKYLRSLIMSKDNAALWKAARKNVPGLPDCPAILAEPRYAAVVFDQHCFACGISRSSCTDFSMTFRFCGPCFKANIRKGKDIRFKAVGIPDDVLERIWSLLVAAPTWVSVHPNEDPDMNHIQQRYHVAEFRAVFDQLKRLRDDPLDLQRFVDDRLAFTRQRQQHGKAVSLWYEECRDQRYMDGEEVRAEREKAIKEKLSELGYSEADYPENEAWDKIFDQRIKLTDRIWKNIRPKLEELLEQEKNDRITAAFDARVEQRRKEIHVFYEAFVDRNFEPDARTFLPNLCDAGFLPSATELATANDAQDVITENRFAPIEAQLLVEMEVHAKNVKRDLYRVLVEERQQSGDKTPVPDIDHDQLEVELAGASALFYCTDCDPRHGFIHPARTDRTLSAAEICAHWREKHPLQKWTAGYAPYTIEQGNLPRWLIAMNDAPRVLAIGRGQLETASAALGALGLPEDTAYAEVDELVRAGTLVCLCGDPTLPPPELWSWAKLVNHLWREREWYSRKCALLARSYAHFNVDHFVLDDHPLTEESSCLTILTEDEEPVYPDYAPAPKVAKEIRAMIEASGTRGIVCETCRNMYSGNRQATCVEHLQKDVDVIAHHVKAKHGKALEKKDVYVENE
ncbi:hypothetical protein C8Q80DRAFT_1211185 [Daedaleopsis nitida]|nr:hypothetical protein C8Q80DRAFT_1211185 [Daedaleopsis nitida]